MKIIARIRSDLPTKFGIPRQSGREEELAACIVFEPEYRVREAVKGLEDFSHIWLLWEFSQSIRENWSPSQCCYLTTCQTCRQAITCAIHSGVSFNVIPNSIVIFSI